MGWGDPQRFLLQRWPEGLVVFDRELGDTHAMGEPTASLFEAWLSQHQRPLAQLADQLDGDASALQSALDELWRLFPQP